MYRAGLVPFHPILVALLPVASMYAAYPGRSDLEEIVRASGVAVAAGVAFWAVLALPLRSARKAAVLASAVMLLIAIVPSDVVRGLNDSWLGRIGLTRRRYLLGLVGMPLAVLAVWLSMTRRSLDRMTVALNVVAVGFLLQPIAALTAVHVAAWHPVSRHGPPVPIPVASVQPAARPDIYYIVLDRYGDAATLGRHGLDNEPFYRFLESRGFYVARSSRSNYMKTALSVASSLNMTYHDDLVRVTGEDSGNWLPINYRVRHHAVGRFLKGQGYSYIHAGSWWWPTQANPEADENINYFTAAPQPVMLLFDQPLLAPFARALDSPLVDARRQQWERVHRQVDALARVPARRGPKFVFAHLLVPHPPYVFNADGSYVSRELQGRRTRNENYRNQVLLANRMVARLVDRILAASASPPVILLQGDEGPYPANMGGDGAYRFRKMTAEDIKFRSGILNAYYLPGPGRDRLYDSISPVNSYRVVFNAYFGTALPLLPDRVYRHDSEKRPYALVDVTHIARGDRRDARRTTASVRPRVERVVR